MNAKSAIVSAMNISDLILKTYLSDLSDAELLNRPPGSNHLAWQLGHLINSEVGLLASICPECSFTLPEGFGAAHGKENNSSNDPGKFKSKQEYLELLSQVRNHTAQALHDLPETDLDLPAPEKFRAMFPTVGDIFTLIATHGLMHAGQFAVVRRQLNKPVLI